MRSVLFDLHETAGARMVTVDGWDVPDVFSSLEAECAAAHHAAVVCDSSPLGRLRLTGRTRIDFMQRMSTNDLNSLRPGQGAATIFTTPLARIIDRTVAYVRDDDVLMLTSRGALALVSNWLRKHIFFNDDVQVRDAAGEFSMLSIYGPTASEIAARIAGQAVDDLKLHAWRPAHGTLIVARTDPIGGDGFHVLVVPDMLPGVWQAALAAGAVPLGERAFELLRIEAGLPRYPHELSAAYIPLEVGLWGDVSFSKGCYTGQEIIARMESRHKLAKQLVGLRAAAVIDAGAELRAGGSSVGQVTSAAIRPDGSSIALAVVKPAFAAPGTRLLLGEGSSQAEVVALPIG